MTRFIVLLLIFVLSATTFGVTEDPDACAGRMVTYGTGKIGRRTALKIVGGTAGALLALIAGRKAFHTLQDTFDPFVPDVQFVPWKDTATIRKAIARGDLFASGDWVREATEYEIKMAMATETGLYLVDDLQAIPGKNLVALLSRENQFLLSFLELYMSKLPEKEKYQGLAVFLSNYLVLKDGRANLNELLNALLGPNSMLDAGPTVSKNPERVKEIVRTVSKHLGKEGDKNVFRRQAFLTDPTILSMNSAEFRSLMLAFLMEQAELAKSHRLNLGESSFGAMYLIVEEKEFSVTDVAEEGGILEIIRSHYHDTLKFAVDQARYHRKHLTILGGIPEQGDTFRDILKLLKPVRLLDPR